MYNWCISFYAISCYKHFFLVPLPFDEPLAFKVGTLQIFLGKNEEGQENLLGWCP